MRWDGRHTAVVGEPHDELTVLAGRHVARPVLVATVLEHEVEHLRSARLHGGRGRDPELLAAEMDIGAGGNRPECEGDVRRRRLCRNWLATPA